MKISHGVHRSLIRYLGRSLVAHCVTRGLLIRLFDFWPVLCLQYGLMLSCDIFLLWRKGFRNGKINFVIRHFRF